MNGGAAINRVCTKPQGWGVSRTALSGRRRGGGGRAGRGACGRHAFTLVEILAVTVIIVILLSIALPAFSNILYSQEESAAESQLQAGISAARDTAIRSGSAQDTAAVFTFEPGGRTSIITCVRVGVIDDPTAPANSAASYDVFVPFESGPPIQLPKNWMVRGYAPQNRIKTGPGKDGWYSSADKRYPSLQPAWVFPETAFFNHALASDGVNRNTFMVRFEGGTGAINMAEQAPVLVVLPRASGLNRPSGADDQWKRPDRAENLRDWAARVLAESSLTPTDRWAIIGRPSGDMVMAAPVPSVALYDETRLAAALKARVDPISGSIYEIEKTQKTEYNEGRKIEPRLVTPLDSQNADVLTGDISAWLEGWKDRQFASRAEVWSARMFTMNKYQGTLRSVASAGLGGR